MVDYGVHFFPFDFTIENKQISPITDFLQIVLPDFLGADICQSSWAVYFSDKLEILVDSVDSLIHYVLSPFFLNNTGLFLIEIDLCLMEKKEKRVSSSTSYPSNENYDWSKFISFLKNMNVKMVKFIH